LDLLPEAKLALVYRAPWEVIDSLYRRGDEVFSKDPGLAVDMWLKYNRTLLDVAYSHGDRCLLVSLETISAHPAEWVAALSDATSIPLTLPNSALYERELLHGSKAADRVGALYRCYPEVVELYSALESRCWRPPGVEALPPWANTPTRETERTLAVRDWYGSCARDVERQNDGARRDEADSGEPPKGELS